MNTLFEASGFQVEITKDGSPTLKQHSTSESMHHSAGASTETWYIYGSVMETVFKQPMASQQTIEVCNVGLGLGYIEMAWAMLAAKKSTSLDSFEIVPALTLNFQNWIAEETSQEIYAAAATSLIAACPFQIITTVSDTQRKMQQQIAERKLIFHSDVMKFNENKKWNIICFDAFSKKTNSELWSPEFLNHFLDKHAASDCVFTTYAATKSLKDALKANGFKEMNRPGFSGKRESTLAVRGAAMLRAFQTF